MIPCKRGIYHLSSKKENVSILLVKVTEEFYSSLNVVKNIVLCADKSKIKTELLNGEFDFDITKNSENKNIDLIKISENGDYEIVETLSEIVIQIKPSEETSIQHTKIKMAAINNSRNRTILWDNLPHQGTQGKL